MMRTRRLGSLSFAALASLVAAAAPPGEAHAGAFDGRWVLVQRMTTTASLPVIGEIEAKTTVISMHDLSGDESKLGGAGTLCKISIDSGTVLVSTILPEAFRRVLPPPVLDADLVVENGTVQLRQPKRVVVVGAALKAPGDPLPQKASDPRVIDQDGDKKPGVTIRVEGIVDGDMYVVQRSWTKLHGAFLKDGTFGGELAFGNEQVILGSTSPLLGDPPKSSPVPRKSWFRIVRLEEGATCKDARRVAGKYL